MAASASCSPTSGNIAEIPILSRAISEAERDTIERYLLGEYGL
jgi:hypothetical protein